MSRRLAVVLSVPVLVLAGAGVGYGAAAGNPSTAARSAGIPQVERLAPDVAALAGFTALPTARPPGHASLGEEVLKFAGALGIGLDHADLSNRLTAARLGPQAENMLAGLVAQLGLCATETRAAQQQTPHADLVAGRKSFAPERAAALRACAVSLRALAEPARLALRSSDSGGKDLTIWPVLAYSPGKADNTYREDYALLVDAGGNDTYLNNQGSNMLDLKRSLTSPVARYHEPARGCFMTYPDSTTGRIRPAPSPNGERVASFDGPECVPVAGLLMDLGGDDTYGAMAKPVFPDTQCSEDPSVQRFTTIGSGVEGVSVVIEEAGNDTYLGRTGTMGAGHIGGVGLLEDRAGNDSYKAMRNAMGLGLLGGTGVLRDMSGDDHYDYYMPRPLDPKAPFQEDGSGGVVDDSGLLSEVGRSPHKPDGVGGRCDNKPRSLQGVGIFVGPANGVLVDESGDDYYRAAGYRNQDEGFPTQTGTGLVKFAHGSQGSGFLGGFGAMFDLSGYDRYVRQDYSAAPNRRNGQFEGPTLDLTADEEGSPENGKPVDLHVFYDAK